MRDQPDSRSINAWGWRSRCTSGSQSPFRELIACGLALVPMFIGMPGCESALQRIDRRVNDLMTRASDDLGPIPMYPDVHRETSPEIGSPRSAAADADYASESPATTNPPPADISFSPREEADDVLRRLEAYADVPADAWSLDLPAALEYAFRHSREYRFAEEEYVLAALRLLIERHLWGPRLFNDITATAFGEADDYLFDSSIAIINELRITQRLPYGGEISARALAQVAEDLHQRVAGEEFQSADLILEADLPLLRGAGLAARDDRIQAERELIYGARDFEQFRRDFFLEITRDFLDLVVQQESVVNAERRVLQLQGVEARERSLYESGRTPRFQAALAEQATVTALDELYSRQESYRLAVDRFKVRLNIPVDRPVAILPSGMDLAAPEIDMDDAVRTAFGYRLDLQTLRDRTDDARRQIDVAHNGLLPDLDFRSRLTVPSDPGSNSFRPDAGESSYSAGLTLSLPLDRGIERVTLRQAQIQLERATRVYEQQRDTTAVNVRGSVRDIDRALYTLQIQERSIEIGKERVASIEAAPDRATARDASEAANELLRAQDRRDVANRDLQVAILRYLLETGQLRVQPTGLIQPLEGMKPIDRNIEPPAEKAK